MSCLSLGFIENLCIELIIICAVIAAIRVVVPLLLSLIGAPVGGAIAQLINIVLWAIVAIMVVMVVFGLLSCLIGGAPFHLLR